MSGRSSTPPPATRKGIASPPMSRPPPLQSRWAANATDETDTSAAAATAATDRRRVSAAAAALTSPVSAGLPGGDASVRSAVVTHRFHKVSAAMPTTTAGGGVSAGGSSTRSSMGAATSPPATHTRAGGSGRHGRVTETPGDPHRPDWDFAAGEDTELQQIAGEIPPLPSSSSRPLPRRAPPVMADTSLATPPDNGRQPAGRAVTRKSLPGSPTERAVVAAAARQRSNNNSPLTQNSLSNAQVTPTAPRSTHSPTMHVRSSPYQSGSFLPSTGEQPENAPVNVVCRQRQTSPTNNVFLGAGRVVGMGGGGVSWLPPQQLHYAHRASSSGNSTASPTGDGPSCTATASAAGVQQQQQSSSAPTAASHPLDASNGRVMDHTRNDDDFNASAGAATGPSSRLRAPSAPTTTTATTTSNNRSALPATAPNSQRLPPPCPWQPAESVGLGEEGGGAEEDSAAVARAQHPHQHQQQQPLSSLACAALIPTPATCAEGAWAAEKSKRASLTNSPAPAQTMVTKPFTEKDRLAVLAGVQCNEQHLNYPSVRIPDENLNKGNTDANQRRLEQRRKQIMYGKDTDGYRKYVKTIPHVALREFHNPMHPITPRPENDCSKRAFDKHLNTWRRQLHQWDDCNGETLTEAFRPLGVATLGELGLAERAKTPLPRPLSATGLPRHQHHHSLHSTRSTMQSIASLATPAAVQREGSQAQLSAKAIRGFRSPTGVGGIVPIASFGSFHRDNAGIGSGNNSMVTPFNRPSSGNGRPSSATDCPTPNITFSFHRMNSSALANSGSGHIVSPSSGGVGGGHGVINPASDRGLPVATASTPYRPQSADGPEVDSSFFFNGGNGSRMCSPLVASVAQLDFGGGRQGGGGYLPGQGQPIHSGPYAGNATGNPNYNNNNTINGSGSPLNRATPFSGNGRTPAHHRPSSGTLADRTPTGSACHSFAAGGGGVMSRLLDYKFDLITDSARASPAANSHACGGHGAYYPPASSSGLVPIPSHSSPYRWLDSNCSNGGADFASGGVGLIPSTVVAPPPQRQHPHPHPRPHPHPHQHQHQHPHQHQHQHQHQYQQPQQVLERPQPLSLPTSSHLLQSGRDTGTAAAPVLAASHATPPYLTQQPQSLKSAATATFNSHSVRNQPPEVQLTASELL